MLQGLLHGLLLGLLQGLLSASGTSPCQLMYDFSYVF